MEIRKGFISLSLKKLKKFQFFWFIKQAFKYQAIKRAFQSESGKVKCGPIIAHIFCTKICDSGCPMCDIPQRKSDYEMTTDDCLNIFKQLKELGVSGVSFTGGEPLLRTDIFFLLKKSMEYGFVTMLVTNGLTLNEHLEEVVDLNLAAVNISLDGANAKVHDANRGLKGAFARTTKNIRLLLEEIRKKRKDTEVVISTVITQNNIDDLGNILMLCNQMGIKRVIICPVHTFEDARLESLVLPIKCNYDLSTYLIKHPLRKIIDNSDGYLRQISAVISRKTLPPTGCTASYTTIFIDYELKVYPCKAYFELKAPLANLKNGRSLKEIWNSGAYAQFRKSARECQRCYLTVNREFDYLIK
jgi:pyrroloquinoline quinone biosynthesis protein E